MSPKVIACLQAAGTQFVESLQSYIQRLAIEHNFRPRILLELLTQEYPLIDLEFPSHFFKKWNIHGFEPLGAQLLSRLELTTGRDLKCASLSRLPKLFAGTHLLKPEPHYCPECVRASGPIPHGPLHWEIDCVKACPQHGVRLRLSSLCGATKEQRLSPHMRPMRSNVCSACGNIGFRCVSDELKQGSVGEVWAAKQVGALLGLFTDRVAVLSPELLRAGIQRMVDERFGGSVVRAASEVGLSRSLVCTWVKGTKKPSLGLLLTLCHKAEAELIGVLEGEYVHAEDVMDSSE